jgi:hypothetical protein
MDKTAVAKAQLDKLEALISANETSNKRLFFSKIDNSLSQTNISDAKEMKYSSDIITEFKSEISIEKIADIVTSAVHTANSEITLKVDALSTDSDNMKIYVDMVNSVSEAAKSTSSAATNLVYSMNRLSPGILMFLYASSKRLNDLETFGEETVISTAIYYRLMYSIDDVKNIAAFDALQIDIESLAKLKTLQAALLDELANNKIDYKTWKTLDTKYSEAVKQIGIRIIKARKITTKPMQPVLNNALKSNKQLIQASIKKLSKMGNTNKRAVLKSQERLSNDYFNEL